MSDAPTVTAEKESSGRGRARRFALVGVVNTAIDFVGFGLLAAGGLPLLLANFLSTTAGMTFGFLTTATGLWIVQPVVIWLVGDVLATVSGTDGALVEVWIPKACAIGVALVWNFALYHLVVFPAVEDGEDG